MLHRNLTLEYVIGILILKSQKSIHAFSCFYCEQHLLSPHSDTWVHLWQEQRGSQPQVNGRLLAPDCQCPFIGIYACLFVHCIVPFYQVIWQTEAGGCSAGTPRPAPGFPEAPQPAPVAALLPRDSISQLAPRPPPWRPRREDGGARVALGYCALPAAGTGAACCPSAAGTGPVERSVPPIPRRARGRASPGARCPGGGSRVARRRRRGDTLVPDSASRLPAEFRAGSVRGEKAAASPGCPCGDLPRLPVPRGLHLRPARDLRRAQQALWLPGQPRLTTRLSR